MRAVVTRAVYRDPEGAYVTPFDDHEYGLLRGAAEPEIDGLPFHVAIAAVRARSIEFPSELLRYTLPEED